MLLDTHVLIWLVDKPDRLGPHARAAIETASEVFASSISHVELRVKEAVGRLRLPEDFRGLLARQRLTPLPFHERHADALPRFPELVGHDPFDRMLVAQADADRLTFLTVDRRLLQLGREWIVDASK